MSELAVRQFFVRQQDTIPLTTMERIMRRFRGDSKIRCLIEGGYQDDWNRHHLDGDRYVIPDSTTTIRIGFSYDLDLIARVNGQGDVEFVDVDPRQRTTVEPDYNSFRRIQRPRAVITEDGRIFYDRELLGRESPNLYKLPSLIEILREIGSFDDVYEKFS